MEKQHFDHIENRIRQAAENVSPPFSEEAWKNMEVLLDREREKKRRALIWFWPVLLFVLLAGSGLIYFYNDSETEKLAATEPNQLVKPDIGKTSPAPRQQKTDRSRAASDNTSSPTDLKSEKAIQPTLTPQTTEGNEPGKNQQNQSSPPADLSVKPGSVGISNNKTSGRVNDLIGNVQNNRNLTAIGPKGGLEKAKSPVEVPAKTEGNVATEKPGSLIDKQNPPDLPVKEPTVGEKTSDIAPQIAKDSLLKNAGKDSIAKTTLEEVVKDNKIKLDQPRPRFYFTASIATESSSLDTWSANNRRTVFGAGVGYHFNKRFALQTGFYAGRKLYTAGAGDYKVKPGSYWSMVDIMRIDADCYMYEIPLSLRYDVVQGSRFNIYAVGGIASIFMKKETYGYTYKRSGVDHWAERSYTGNKNYLSMAELSLGFEYKVLPAFYLQAEPNLTLPVSGIGEGKIKLYSAGVQVGVKYQPLRRINKK